jgi:hypothetical protein
VAHITRLRPFLARRGGAADCDLWYRAAPVCVRLHVGSGAPYIGLRVFGTTKWASDVMPITAVTEAAPHSSAWGTCAGPNRSRQA